MSFCSSKINNGLTILTYNMPYLQSVAINLIVKVGSRYETAAEEGMSHFLEHMAFKGTKTRTARQIAEEFDSIGGQFNAYTSREQTVYYAKVLTPHLSSALEILADIMQNSVFAPEDIDKEYQVILQEIAGVYDNPDELAYEMFYSTAYQNQPLGKSILGTKETIAKFDSASIKHYLSKHYNASEMYLSFAGNVEHDYVVKLSEKLFVDLVDSGFKGYEKSTYTGGVNIINKDLEQTTLVLGFESVPYINLNPFYCTQILSLILGGGISSRLFQQIRENLGLAYAVGSYNSSYSDSGIFSIYASTHPEKVNLLTKKLALEIDLIQHGISNDELMRAKEQVRASIYMAEEKSSYKSEEIGKNFSIFGKYLSAHEVIEQIMNITSEDIINIAQKIFKTNPTISIVGTNDYGCTEKMLSYFK